MYKLLVCALIAASVVGTINALKCIECSGSEISDCAKGVKGAGVEVKCDAPDYEAQGYAGGGTSASSSSEESGGTTETDATTTEPESKRSKRLSPLGCFQPLKLYPQCVTYSMELYNGVGGQKLTTRGCRNSQSDFCKEFGYSEQGVECKACNSTDFCM